MKGKKIKTVFFDMNETLLNLGLLKEQFDMHFDDAYVLKYWFSKLLHSSTVMGVMEVYQNFGILTEVELENVFFENNKTLTEAIKGKILGAFKKLPAYNDVLPTLTLLKEHNIRIIAISNSSLAMMDEQLENAKIKHFFDAYYSVDMVQKYKPFSNVYLSVIEKEKINISETIMIATHDWDLFGAKKVGLTTGYIERKRKIFNPCYATPDFKATNLTELISQII